MPVRTWDPDDALDFHPAMIPLDEFPFPVGTVVRASFGIVYTVVDRGGYTYLACCAAHEHGRRAGGFYPETQKGQMLTILEAAPDADPAVCGEPWWAGDGRKA
ncbi:MAG: hypothetical protein ACRDPY_04105 [Streptosporangiaceae bacterium]